MQQQPYTAQEKDVLRELGSSEDGGGLSSREAEERISQYGKNELRGEKKTPLLVRFLKQLAEPMTLVLLAAAAISAVTSAISHEFPSDVLIILAVVLLNAVLGTVQESKAEDAIEALKKMAPQTAKVMRDGRLQVIHGESVVPGDVILLEAGDAVPADGRLIECASLKIEEAALTGESVPVEKSTAPLKAPSSGEIPLGDRRNMVYSGSTAVYGRGRAVITATGMNTEKGQNAGAPNDAEEGKTPLQKKLAGLSKTLTWLVLGICVVIFGVTLLRGGLTGGITGGMILDTFLVAVSLAVAAIPEGLSTVVTVVLSIGVTNMSRRGAIIRKLTAVEALGCASIICSDKTGTLTKNRMTVVETREGEGARAMLAAAMSLCSDAVFDRTAGEAVGEPTECALVNFAEDEGFSKENGFPRVGEIPFDSSRKLMTTVHERRAEIPGCPFSPPYLQFTKGAPDELLARCSSVLEGGKLLVLTEEKKKEILAQNKELADNALRVLGAAVRAWESEPDLYESDAMERELVFVGLVGMIDPVRPEVKAAVQECFEAGIRPVMITGDHKDTAVAIAKELGILNSPEEAITGAELEKIPEEEFERTVDRYSVYARVQPEHKTRIVRAWQARGCITAMTGDGVNDAPSIKTADIGVGMGITGTDVTKNAADMILTDDNFATIVSAVREGRRIYDNIRRSIQYLLASNLSEVLSIFVATLCGWTLFKPVHLLWINLITDSLPALSLGMEKEEKDSMRRPPRPANEGIFADGVGFSVIYQGLAVTLLTLVSYFLGRFVFAAGSHAAAIAAGHYDAEMLGETMAFLTLSMAEIVHAFNLRALRGSLFEVKGQNPYLWGSAALSLLLTALVIEVPGLANLFHLAPLSLPEYATSLALALTILPIVELVKVLQRKFGKKKAAVK